MTPARSLIVGTAGHIDHGKSTLVLALTGTDPDRLKEEKERGITIDLGFAHLDLGEGQVASFVDVPGHEKFVRHMVAGAHGLDAVVLVVAADESVMPQTREHFHICRLLGIPRGLVALTKCDAADPELQALAEMEVREMVAGSFLEGAPVLRVSARTGAGLDALKDALRRLASDVAPRGEAGIARLPIDRAFSLRGFGTVVTGTLRGGAIAAGDELAVVPGDRRVRVRGLQVHGGARDRVGAGNRAAVNVVGIEVAELARGDVLTSPGGLRATSVIDVLVSLLPGERPLADQARLRVHVGTAEVLARVRLLEGPRMAAGSTAVAQLRLERPVAAGRGDRIVLRTYSPPATIGGARVLDPQPGRRKGRLPFLTALLAAEREGEGAVAALMVDDAGPFGVEPAALAARLAVPASAIPGLLEGRATVDVGGAFLSRGALDALAAATVTALTRFHKDQPLRPGMPREELRTRVFGRAPEGALARVLSDLQAAGKVRAETDTVFLAAHEVRLNPQEESARRALLEAAARAGLSGVELAAIAPQAGAPLPLLERVARVLTTERALLRVGDVLVERGALESLKSLVRERYAPGTKLEVGALKDMTGLSRKFVIPLLEYLDRERVTRRAGPTAS